MPRRLRSNGGRYPLGHGPQLAGIVVEAGDDQRGQFEPDIALAHFDDGVADRLPTSAADSPVEVVAGGLQVYVGGVEIRRDQLDCLGRFVAVGHKDVVQAGRPRLDHRVERELDEYRGLNVRVGDGSHAGRDGLRHDRLGRNIPAFRHDALAVGLGNLPVLAVGAVHVAALGRDRVGVAARQEVVEGLLLDRLGLRHDDLAVDEGVQTPAAVLADAAYADPARAQDAAMGAGHASDAAGSDRIVELLAKQGWPDVRLRLVAWAKVGDPKTCRRLLAREPGANWIRRHCVGIDLDGRRLGEGLGAASWVRLFVHQGL